MASSTKASMPWSHWHERLHKRLRDNPKLLPQGASLLLSISGGQDSMALLKLIVDLKRIYCWNLNIWHGDHGWHEHSEEIRKELQKWCRGQDLNFFYDHTDKKQTKSESLAREWRYSQLTKLAEKLITNEPQSNCIYIITGHTSSDKAETLIINLARGAHLAGLSSLQEKRMLGDKIELIRPMLGFSRNETSQICNEMKLPIWLDPSNQNTSLVRNKIRKYVIPVLEENYPGCSIRIAAMSQRLSKYKDDQYALASLALKSLQLYDGLNRKELNKLTLTAKNTIIENWLKQNGVESISANKLENLSHRLDTGKSPGSQEIGDGLKIVWEKEIIKIQPTKN